MTRNYDARSDDVLAFRNPEKVPGDKRPAFLGTLKLPGDHEHRQLSLWLKRRDNGHVLLHGHTGKDADAQIEELLGEGTTCSPAGAALVACNTEISVEPLAIVLFQNSRKTKDTPQRPAYLGYYHPGDGDVLMRVAVWTRNTPRGQPSLAGRLDPDTPHEGTTDIIVPYTYAHPNAP